MQHSCGRVKTRTSTSAAALVTLASILVSCAVVQPALGADTPAPQTAPSEPFLLGPPTNERPVVVRARFDLHDVNEINDEAETFEIVGALTLVWRDPRQAFDPAIAGVDEKIFQGDFQFNEISPGWYPQVVLVNESGLYEKSGVVLRVQPDGTSTQIEMINAVAEAEFDMRRFPFDSQTLEAVFEVLGFDREEVLLEVDAEASRLPVGELRTSQWTISGASVSVRDHTASYAGPRGVSSAFVLAIDAKRQSWYARRLVVVPLIIIVLLSFSVFWMDRSSLGDRLSVSFIGILTAVAYQMTISDHLPPIAYRTLMHSFLGWSFLTMCTTVVVNLVVGGLDKRNRSELGDLVDRRCRWGFPLAYFGVILLMLAAEYLNF